MWVRNVGPDDACNKNSEYPGCSPKSKFRVQGQVATRGALASPKFASPTGLFICCGPNLLPAQGQEVFLFASFTSCIMEVSLVGIKRHSGNGATRMAEVRAGLQDVVVATSQICSIDGQRGKLSYWGYDIHDLAANSTFEEVVYLLWHGRLP